MVSNEKNKYLEIKFCSNGFKRIHKSIKWERKIILGEKVFEVVDIISGKGMREIKTYFHWDPGMQIKVSEHNEINFSTNKIGGNFICLCNEDSNFQLRKYSDYPLGGFVKSYGELLPSDSLEITAKVNLPVQMNYKINWA